MWAQLFLSTMFIGFAIVALAATHVGVRRSHLPAGDQVASFAIGGALMISGVLGARRCLRLDLRLDGSVAKVRGVTRSWRVPLGEVSAVGFGSTFLARSLYLIGRDERTVMAPGVSYQGARVPPEATAMLNTVEAAIESAGGDLTTWALDPVPDLPVSVLEPEATPPLDTVITRLSLRPLYWITARSMVFGGAATLFGGIGVQAALPRAFPWVVVGASVYVLLVDAGSVLLFRRTVGRFDPAIATGKDRIALKIRQSWRPFDLSQLAGVGATRKGRSTGIFGRTMTVTELCLVDLEGHRMTIDHLTLTDGLRQLIVGHLTDQVTVTDSAREVLHLAH